MSGSILTPVGIWGDFSINGVPSAVTVEEKSEDGVVCSRLIIDGRDTSDGQVKIFGELFRGKKNGALPLVFFVRDFTGDNDEQLIMDLVSRGFAVFNIDLVGIEEGKTYFTSYPESVSYANYKNAEGNLFSVKGDVKDTCWYEWAAACRYALAYLKSLPSVKSIGGFGIGEAATVLWQVAAMDDALSCAVFAMNAGWSGYRGIHKFGGKVEPQFSDDMLKFIAGVEPQAYAMHVKCPVLMLSPTNSSVYDADRTFDTVTRIEKSVYTAVHYSIGYRDKICLDAYENAVIFFESFICGKKKELPSEIDINCELLDGKIRVEVAPDVSGIKKVRLWAAEEITEPSQRCWNKISTHDQTSDDTFVFDYTPYYKSGIVTFFATAEYKNGFIIGSNVIARKFQEDEIAFSYKSNIIYSSRILDCESIFTAENQGRVNVGHVNTLSKKRVLVKKGPMGIDGVYCEWGLLTFKVKPKKYAPSECAMLMFDVYAKNDCEVSVKLIADIKNTKTEYVARVKIRGGDVWHNVRLEQSRFKTAEGMSLKSYEKIDALSFSVEGTEYLINNALWV